MSMPGVVLLDSDPGGHHAFWLALLIGAWRRAGWRVDVLGPADTARIEAQARLHGVDLVGVKFHVAGEGGEGVLLRQAAVLAREVGAERVFVAFLDRFLGAIMAASAAPGAGEGDVKLMGIWFHPHALDARWRWAPALGKRWRLRGRAHRFWRGGGAARLLASVFFLDEDAAARSRRLAPDLGAEVVDDPFEQEPRLPREDARRVLGLPAGRRIFLHLGSPERRKGLPDTLRAWERLCPRFSGDGRPLLLRVGSNERLGAADRERLAALVRADEARIVERFVPADEMANCFAAADWVLIPYRKFRFSSGILANAIGARRPVIASDNGLIGDTVRAKGLGFLYRPGSTGAFLAALERAARMELPFEADWESARRRLHPRDWIDHVASLLAKQTRP